MKKKFKEFLRTKKALSAFERDVVANLAEGDTLKAFYKRRDTYQDWHEVIQAGFVWIFSSKGVGFWSDLDDEWVKMVTNNA